MATAAETLRIPQVDYSSRDYEALVHDLIDKIPFYFPNGEWTDHNPSDLGIGLIELFSYLADGLHFYIDRMANEAFLPTAISRQNVINLLKLIDYELKSASPSNVDLRFTLGQAQAVPVTIPAGTVCQTSGSDSPVLFETDEDLVIPAGSLTGTTSATEGQSQDETLDPSDGTTFQSRELTPKSIIDGTIRVFVDEGSGEEEWVAQDTLALSLATDKHFNTQRDSEDRATIFFGDGGQGKVPMNGATIRSEYRVGGGTRGNVGDSVVIVVVSTIYASGNPITVDVTNPAAASGGEDAESIDNAKVMGPRSLRTLNRAVTEEDYTALAIEYPGIAKANCIPQSPRVYRIVNLHIAPVGGGMASAGLKEQLHDYLDSKNPVNDVLEIVDAEYVPINITGVVHVKDNYVRDDVEAAVLAAISEFFAFDGENSDFDIDIHLSDIYRLVDSIDGVDYVDYTRFTLSPQLKKLVWSGNAVVVGFVVGDTAKKETWTLVMTSPTTFSLEGTVSGLQLATGTVDIPYTSDGGEVTFTLQAGSNPMSVGDRGTFRTSIPIGNVDIQPWEIAQEGSIDLTFEGGA